MDSFMIFQCIRSMETLSAASAFVAPFAAMDQTVLVEHRTGEETFATLCAVVWAFAGVTFSDVVIQIGTYCESSGAARLGTTKWFDSCESFEIVYLFISRELLRDGLFPLFQLLY